MNFATTKERIIQYIDFQGIKIKDFYKKTGIKRGFLDSDKLKSSVSDVFLATIFATFDNINPIWLITGEGEMLKNKQGGEVEKSKNLIPFYDDVATIGGTDLVADTYNAVSAATDYIDAGDWFPSATAAIRHYGTSMVEYPNGCILALKRIYDTNSIVWGRNYVIETDEIRVTKRMQTCKTDDECVMAYSTNTETYPDGQLVHEPFKIRKENIRRIFLVLGRVVKEYSSDPVFVG